MRSYAYLFLIALGVTAIPSIPVSAHGAETGFVSALVSEKPNRELGDAASVLGWLVGDWNVRVVDYGDHGSRSESTGEWHFAWVLEGRAIQDVWIVPLRNERHADTPRLNSRYGTSLRMFDPNDGTWKITWLNPVTGAHDELVAKRIGSDIVQTGRDAHGNLMRWVFTDIHPDSFRWYGERSYDNGHSWTLEAEFFARRAGSDQG